MWLQNPLRTHWNLASRVDETSLRVIEKVLFEVGMKLDTRPMAYIRDLRT